MGTLEILGYGDHGDFLAPNALTPQQASETYKTAAEYGEPLSEVTQGMRDAYREKQVFENSGPVFQKNMQNPVFKAAVAGDEKAPSTLETIVRATAGDPNETGLLATARKSVARGIQGLGQASDVGDLINLREELDRLREENAAGNTKEYDRRHKAIEEEIARISVEVARSNALREALSADSPLEKFGKAYAKGGWGEAFSAMGNDVSAFFTDLFGEQAVQVAPVVGTAAAATTATGLTFGTIPALVATGIGAAVTGLSSFYQDSRLGILDRMADYGLDKNKPEDIAYFFTSHSRYADARNAQYRHSAVVGGVDAVSFGLGTKMMPRTLGATAHVRMPAAAQAYEKFNENLYRYTFAKLTSQGAAQSALGAAGEAGGQLAADGGITDPVSIALEAMGEGMTGPFEAAFAFRATHNRLVQERQVAQARKEFLKQAVDIVRTSPSLQETPELMQAYTQELAQTYGVGSISVDVATLAQSEQGAQVVEAMRQAAPMLAKDIDEAVASGGSVDVPLAEYFAITKDENAAGAILDQSSLPGEPTEAEAVQAEQNVTDSKKAGIARFTKGQSPEFRASLQKVAQEYGAELGRGNGATQTENAAILTLTMAHVASMAKDLGVLPEQIWKEHGVRRVLGPQDLSRDENGVVTAVSPEGEELYPRPEQTSPTAMGSFSLDKNIIVRWANANRSTLLHETGHWFMKARAQIAADLKGRTDLTESQKQFVLWTEKAVKWMGAKDLKTFLDTPLEERRAGEEKFARTYEQYLKEGKAPSTELQSIFRRFSAWLKRIYGALTAVRGSELTPDAQELFDALFVSSEQVKEAQLRRHVFLQLDALKKNGSMDKSDEALRRALNVLMKDTDEAAMEAYRERGEKQIGVLRRLHDRITADLDKQAAKLREQYTREAIASSFSERYHKAMEFINAGIERSDSKGREMNTRPKFYVKDLRAVGATEEQIAKLREMKLVSDTKGLRVVPAEEFSQLLGYSGAAEMVQEFTFDPFNGHDPKDAVRFIVERRMEEEHPELVDHETIEESADAAVFNPTASKMLLLELNFLQGATKKPVTMALFDAAAEGMLQGKLLLNRQSPNSKRLDGEVMIRQWRNDSVKLNEEAQRQIKAGDLDGAASTKRKQLVRDRMAQQAQTFLDVAAKFAHDMKRYNDAKTSSSMPLSYLKQLEMILYCAGLIKKPQEETPNYDSFRVAESIMGYVPEAPTSVWDGRRYVGKPFIAMTVAEATEYMGFVQQLIQAARDRNKMIVNGKKVKAEEIDDMLSSDVINNAEAKSRKSVNQNADDQNRLLNFSHLWRRFRYAHTRLSALFAMLEGKRNGHFFDVIGRPIDAAANRADEIRMEKTRALFGVYNSIKPWLRDPTRRYYESLQGTFTNQQLFAIALQIGNDGNFDALISGSAGYTDFRSSAELWTREGVLEAVGQGCPKEVLDAVQKCWDVCGSLGDELVALEARTRNAQLDKVHPVEVTLHTADGDVTLAGGYYPIQYDRYGASLNSGVDYSEGLSGAPWQRKSSRTGHAKERVAPSGKPIELTLSAGIQALNDTINDVCFREPLMNLNKVIGTNTKTRAAIQKYYGKEAIGILNQWMEDIASGGHINGRMDVFASVLRKNTSIAGLGFNFTTAVLQTIGLTQSAALIGSRWMCGAMWDFIRHPRRANALVMSKSSMMRARAATRFKELNEAYRYASGSRWEMAQNAMGQYAFKPIAFMQIWTVDIPTWIGAYDKHLEAGAKEGLSGKDLEDYAVSRADRDVIDAQGSGRASDLSMVERSRGLESLFTVFYNFFGTALNLGLMIKNTEQGFARAWKLFMIFVAQQSLEAMVREAIKEATTDKQKKDWSERVLTRLGPDILKFQLGVFVGLRELSEVANRVAGEPVTPYSGPVGTRMISDIIKSSQQTRAGLAALKAGTNVASDIFGLPAGQINRLWETADALNDGHIEPYEVPVSLMFGHKKQ